MTMNKSDWKFWSFDALAAVKRPSCEDEKSKEETSVLCTFGEGCCWCSFTNQTPIVHQSFQGTSSYARRWANTYWKWWGEGCGHGFGSSSSWRWSLQQLFCVMYKRIRVFAYKWKRGAMNCLYLFRAIFALNCKHPQLEHCKQSVCKCTKFRKKI